MQTTSDVLVSVGNISIHESFSLSTVKEQRVPKIKIADFAIDPARLPSSTIHYYPSSSSSSFGASSFTISFKNFQHELGIVYHLYGVSTSFKYNIFSSTSGPPILLFFPSHRPPCSSSSNWSSVHLSLTSESSYYVASQATLSFINFDVFHLAVLHDVSSFHLYNSKTIPYLFFKERFEAINSFSLANHHTSLLKYASSTNNTIIYDAQIGYKPFFAKDLFHHVSYISFFSPSDHWTLEYRRKTIHHLHLLYLFTQNIHIKDSSSVEATIFSRAEGKLELYLRGLWNVIETCSLAQGPMLASIKKYLIKDSTKSQRDFLFKDPYSSPSISLSTNSHQISRIPCQQETIQQFSSSSSSFSSSSSSSSASQSKSLEKTNNETRLWSSFIFTGETSCIYCESKSKDRQEYIKHLCLTHFRQELSRLQCPKDNQTQKSNCQFVSSLPEDIILHNGLTHGYIYAAMLRDDVISRLKCPTFSCSYFSHGIKNMFEHLLFKPFIIQSLSLFLHTFNEIQIDNSVNVESFCPFETCEWSQPKRMNGKGKDSLLYHYGVTHSGLLESLPLSSLTPVLHHIRNAFSSLTYHCSLCSTPSSFLYLNKNSFLIHLSREHYSRELESFVTYKQYEYSCPYSPCTFTSKSLTTTSIHIGAYHAVSLILNPPKKTVEIDEIIIHREKDSNKSETLPNSVSTLFASPQKSKTATVVSPFKTPINSNSDNSPQKNKSSHEASRSHSIKSEKEKRSKDLASKVNSWRTPLTSCCQKEFFSIEEIKDHELSHVTTQQVPMTCLYCDVTQSVTRSDDFFLSNHILTRSHLFNRWNFSVESYTRRRSSSSLPESSSNVPSHCTLCNTSVETHEDEVHESYALIASHYLSYCDYRTINPVITNDAEVENYLLLSDPYFTRRSIDTASVLFVLSQLREQQTPPETIREKEKYESMIYIYDKLKGERDVKGCQSRKKLFICFTCPYGTTSYKDLVSHSTSMSHTLMTSQQRDKLLMYNKFYKAVFTCEICDFLCSNMNSLSLHLLEPRHLSLWADTSLCYSSFFDSRLEKKKGTQLYFCDLCNCDFSDLETHSESDSHVSLSKEAENYLQICSSFNWNPTNINSALNYISITTTSSLSSTTMRTNNNNNNSVFETFKRTLLSSYTLESPYRQNLSKCDIIFLTSCLICKMNFHHSTLLMYHSSYAHSLKSQEIFSMYQIGFESRCNKCSLSCSNSLIYALHLDSHILNKDYLSCYLCHKKYTSPAKFYSSDYCLESNIPKSIKRAMNVQILDYISNQSSDSRPPSRNYNYIVKFPGHIKLVDLATDPSFAHIIRKKTKRLLRQRKISYSCTSKELICKFSCPFSTKIIPEYFKHIRDTHLK